MFQVRDSHISTKGGIAAAEISSDNVIQERRNLKKEEGSSSSSSLEIEDGVNKTCNHVHHHPCNIVRLAKIAFLKCLGLDSPPPHPSTNPKQRR